MDMTRSSAAQPTCSCPSGPPLGRTYWSGRCSPNSCSAPHPSLRTIPIIAKVRPMRRFASLLPLLPLVAAGSAPVRPPAVALDQELKRARQDQAAAEAEAARLEQAAAKARGDVARLRAEQAASAQALEAAEARITAADMQLRLASAYVAMH